ncbi:hypothetical protein MRB53_038042 [Persea americana]|nr:hypothetical protein MRB53_038042 [Persea americana]
MASIFTYDPDPPRINSPWEQSQSGQDTVTVVESSHALSTEASGEDTRLSQARAITRLQAEPQEGPVEYKLHLLLGPRRKFIFTSTGSHISGSRHSTRAAESTNARDVPDGSLDAASSNSSAMPASSITTVQARHHRLEQLTTQLLWRLQQSSPHHTSSATNIILPSLPEALPELEAPQQLAKLPHGLEESQGALYEIGVSDDGTLVGLAEDEMLSSLNNLRAMAACLGCAVEILRKEIVGHCQWIDEDVDDDSLRGVTHTVISWSPRRWSSRCCKLRAPSISAKQMLHRGSLPRRPLPSWIWVRPRLSNCVSHSQGPPCRASRLCSATLSTSTLDNGRGKSRLSMLKHRHEITTGITSSVTQELLGYQDTADGSVNVINYATENIASWIDIHAASAGSRLVFVSDSAGHPRYRRTTLRGLIGWAPNWTLLCIPADDTQDTAGVGGGPLPSPTRGRQCDSRSGSLGRPAGFVRATRPAAGHCDYQTRSRLTDRTAQELVQDPRCAQSRQQEACHLPQQTRLCC